jgi:hypothetical protein
VRQAFREKRVQLVQVALQVQPAHKDHKDQSEQLAHQVLQVPQVQVQLVRQD